jgi:hypothetical protein
MASKKNITKAQIKRRDDDRKTSNEKAQRTAGWYSDDAYMSELGKEGIKRTQEHMKDDADWEDVKQQNLKLRSSGKRGTAMKNGSSESGRTAKYTGKRKKKAQGKR